MWQTSKEGNNYRKYLKVMDTCRIYITVRSEPEI